MTTLVLVGPMGAGKTSIGRRVAKALRVPFVDTDSLVIREHGPIPAIFATEGETRFREWERAAVVAAFAGEGVVALGGGSILDADTRADLAHRPVVQLHVADDVVAGRIQGGDRPLLVGEEDPVTRWRRIYAERRPWYDEVSDVVVDTSHGPLSRCVDEIVAWILAHPEKDA